MVDSEEGHLTGLVEQVGKSYEGVRCVQVQDEHCCDERHSLHLHTHKRTHTQNNTDNTVNSLYKNSVEVTELVCLNMQEEKDPVVETSTD